MSTVDNNKSLVRDFWGALSAGDFAKLASIYDENVAYHGPAGDERRGRAAAMELAKAYKTAFPDMRADVEEMVAEGDFVMSRVRPQGTHTAELMGIPPTGRSIDLRWVMNMVRIADGKIAEEWEIWDSGDFMKQLGLA